ncbi:MAG: M23 family metallopeptidase [Tabrizicola sp.]|jgi:murein DD-endopeptidase MepM/ murein hydrolase activator NlpD|nr:M23 family metallopeptidase [Tabrizicola sp.]
MSLEKDPRFQQAANRARSRQKMRRLRLIVPIAGGLCLTLGLAFLLWPGATPPEPMAEAVSPDSSGLAGDELAMVQYEGSTEAGIEAVRLPFLDLPRNPLILYFETDATKTRELTAPEEVPPDRAGAVRPAVLNLLTDDLVVTSTELVTTIPSTRAELAFFQASRASAIATPEDQSPTLAEAGDLVVVSGEDGSWGELIGEGEDTVTYVETQIENTTSVAYLLRETARLQLFRDRIALMQTDRALGAVLTEAGLTEQAAQQAVAAATRLLSTPETLPAGTLVALRLKPEVGGTALLQMTLYDGETYLGTLAQIGPGRYDTGADPWIGEDLLSQGAEARPSTAPKDVRLLDALYSAGIRNGLSTTLVGELIVMMSRSHDLERYATEGDQVTVLLAQTPPADAGAGQLLYAGISGPSGKMDCYVVPDPTTEGFRCAGARAVPGAGGGGGIGYGLQVPVSGTVTSGFGPRMHPILKQVRNHDGVDWGAPIGTPVQAAADGVVAQMGDGGAYGNVIYLDHPGGRQTRYAHLNGFREGLKIGATVAAGELIGYVGSTGRSTGPHLHFELRIDGKAVDPMGGGTTAGGAIDALVARIVTVESAGKADAANSRSTAVGLGQFIEGTWIRMMQTYRPDLVASLSRADLLALRTNPDLSREMIANLARENEAYLRDRGIEATAGRLYLAHFLGSEGAAVALRSDPTKSVLEVMGAGVVNANPFLTGKTMGDLVAWADAKMSGSKGAPVVAVLSAEDRTYMALIDTILSG